MRGRGCRSIYAVYDEQDNGICVAIGNVHEVREFLGMTSMQVVSRAYCTMNRLKKGAQRPGRCRYTVVKIEEDL